jgi:hypothetical protein
MMAMGPLRTGWKQGLHELEASEGFLDPKPSSEELKVEEVHSLRVIEQEWRPQDSTLSQSCHSQHWLGTWGALGPLLGHRPLCRSGDTI